MKAVRVKIGLLIAGAVLCLLLPGLPVRAAPPKKVDAAAKMLMGANGLYMRNRFKFAADDYAEFLAKYPTHAQVTSARYGLAICRLRLA